MKKALLLLFFVSSFSFAQSEKTIDSILKKISTLKSDTDKGKEYSAILGFASDNGLDSVGEKYTKVLKTLGKKGNCPDCEAFALDYEANLIFYSGDFKKAEAAFSSLREIYLKNNNIHMYLQATAKTCESLLYLNKTSQAEKILIETIKQHKNDKVQIGMQGIYYLMASIYYEKKYYNSALYYFFETEKSIQPRHPNGIAYKIMVLGEIASIYKDQNNYKKAIEKIKTAYEISKKEKLDAFSIQFAIAFGVIENYFNHPEKAIPYLKESLSKAIKLKNINDENTAYIALAESYYKLKDYNLSLDYLKKCRDYFEENNDAVYYPKLLLLFSKNYLKINNTFLLNSNINILKKLIGNDKVSINYISFLEIKIEDAINNNLGSLNNLIREKDSINYLINIEKSNISFDDLEAKYQNEKKETQIKLLSTQNQLAKKQKYIYISLLALLALIGGSLFYGYRNKIKTAQKLNELNELKSRFFANISHEFRTPLTLIKSPVQSLQTAIKDENQKSQLNLIDKNSNRMLELVDQLLQLSKIDSGNLKLIFKDGNISSFLTSIIEPFDFQSKEKSINFNHTIQKTAHNNSFDKDVIEKIVTNLVSNAFKYSPENESISFSSSVENATLKLVVSNSGSELKKEDLPKLFERFYQKNEQQQGVGIGLALVKELVDLYKGNISTIVENGKLSFIVDLPLAQSNENAVVIPTKEITSTIENTTTSETELPILLIVDDNADIRTILATIFKDNYQVIEAENGEIALKMAQKEIPDCIISDVMMPKMDGFEFTKAIKNNELTSFIPVVLLTAKTSDEAHLEGLKSTADAYLTKPFNNDIVVATVVQLINERKKLQERYSQELVLRPTDIVINSVDEKFVARLQKALDENVSNADYSADDFAKDAGMSRMQLHRKLKTLFGVSSSEFLRNERLKIAAELLRKGNGNISDVAYSVGFNDLSYFSKCFKEMYNCTPTEYIEKDL